MRVDSDGVKDALLDGRVRLLDQELLVRAGMKYLFIARLACSLMTTPLTVKPVPRNRRSGVRHRFVRPRASFPIKGKPPTYNHHLHSAIIRAKETWVQYLHGLLRYFPSSIPSQTASQQAYPYVPLTPQKERKKKPSIRLFIKKLFLQGKAATDQIIQALETKLSLSLMCS